MVLVLADEGDIRQNNVALTLLNKKFVYLLKKFNF